ncbi:MAG: tail fiber domain-containing protein, partial [Candidatus Magasanikbacteria bacterium]
YNIVTASSSYWDLAHGWGNHALAGYLTAYTETDPIWSAVSSSYLTVLDASSTYLSIANAAGVYLTSALAASTYITDGNTGWDNSYGFITTSTGLTTANFATDTISQWTNNAGYLTAYTETDPIWMAASSSYLTVATAASTYEPVFSVLSIAKGGTNTTTLGASGALAFSDGTGYAFSNTDNLFWDSANGRLGVGTSIPSAVMQVTQNNIGATAVTSTLLLSNTTAAIPGAQQNSPSLTFRGNGWGTTASTSQIMDWRMFSYQNQSTVPSSYFNLELSTNGAAFSPKLKVYSNGTVESLNGVYTTIYSGTSASLKGIPTDGATAVATVLDSTTGLTTAGAKITSFRNAGVEKAFIDKDGLAYFGNNVGIGTTTPNSLLEVYSTTASSSLTITAASSSTTIDPYIAFRTGATPATKFAMGVDSSDSYKFKISSSTGLGVTDFLTITSAGLVGIGTSSPSATLTVLPATSTGNILTVGTSTNSNIFNIGANGKIGIGTAAPSSIFEISNINSPELSLTNASSSDADGGRSSKLAFYGTPAGGSNTNLGYIQMAHDGTGADRKGVMQFFVNKSTSQATTFTATTLDFDLYLYSTSYSGTHYQSFKITNSTGSDKTLNGLYISFYDNQDIGSTHAFILEAYSDDNGVPGTLLQTLYSFSASDATIRGQSSGWASIGENRYRKYVSTSYTIANLATVHIRMSVSLMSNTYHAFPGVANPTRPTNMTISYGYSTNGTSYTWNSSSGYTAYTIMDFSSSDPAAEVARMNSSGFMGIGTTTPNSLLEVYSTTASSSLTITAASSSTTIDPFIAFRTGATPATKFAMGVDSSDSYKFKISSSTGLGVTDFLTITSAGLVGIGTSSPSATLTVLPATATGQILTVGTSTNSNIFNIGANGYVGIGTSTPGYKLQVYIDASNEGHVDSDGSWARTSDARLKKNVSTIGNGLSTVMALRPVFYDSLSLSGNSVSGTNAGFIAQEVEQIFPMAVGTSEISGYKAISYDKFIPLLTAAAQEQQAQIQQLFAGLGNMSTDTASVLSIAPTVFNDKISFKNHVSFDEDSVGYGKILTGATSTYIGFRDAYENLPVITMTPVEFVVGQYRAVVSSTAGFLIELAQAQDKDVSFGWHSFASNKLQSHDSDGTVNLITFTADGGAVIPETPASESSGGGSSAPADEPVQEDAPVPVVDETPTDDAIEDGITPSDEMPVADESVSEEPAEEPASQPVVEPEPELPSEPAPEQISEPEPTPAPEVVPTPEPVVADITPAE